MLCACCEPIFTTQNSLVPIWAVFGAKWHRGPIPRVVWAGRWGKMLGVRLFLQLSKPHKISKPINHCHFYPVDNGLGQPITFWPSNLIDPDCGPIRFLYFYPPQSVTSSFIFGFLVELSYAVSYCCICIVFCSVVQPCKGCYKPFSRDVCKIPEFWNSSNDA